MRIRFYSLHRHFILLNPISTMIYTLSLHDALPILGFAALTVDRSVDFPTLGNPTRPTSAINFSSTLILRSRSEEHTSELQSRGHLVCRLLLEIKNEERSVKSTTE